MFRSDRWISIKIPSSFFIFINCRICVRNINILNPIFKWIEMVVENYVHSKWFNLIDYSDVFSFKSWNLSINFINNITLRCLSRFNWIHSVANIRFVTSELIKSTLNISNFARKLLFLNFHSFDCVTIIDCFTYISVIDIRQWIWINFN